MKRRTFEVDPWKLTAKQLKATLTAAGIKPYGSEKALLIAALAGALNGHRKEKVERALSELTQSPRGIFQLRPRERSGRWNGSLRSAGVLRFKNKAALTKGLRAFAGQSYTEFFDASSWEVGDDGLTATLNLDTELPVDCESYELAFDAIATKASEGFVDVKGIGRRTIRHHAKGIVLEHRTKVTKDPLGEAGLKPAAKKKAAAKKKSKEQSISVRVPCNGGLAIEGEGSLFAIYGKDVTVFDAEASKLRCHADELPYEMTRMAQVGRKVVTARHFSDEVGWWSLDDDTCGNVDLGSSIAVLGDSVLAAHTMEGELRLWHAPTGEVYKLGKRMGYTMGAQLRGDEIIAWGDEGVVAFKKTKKGYERFWKADGECAVVLDDGRVITAAGEKLMLYSKNLERTKTMKLYVQATCNTPDRHDGADWGMLRLDSGRVLLRSSTAVHALDVGKWKLTTLELPGSDKGGSGPLVRIGPTRWVTFAANVLYGESWFKHDANVFVFDSDMTLVSKLNAKCPPRGVVALDDKRVVVRVEDAVNGKVLLIFDATTGRKVGELKGHKKQVLGMGRLANGQLVSWAKDHTARVWK